MVLPTRDVFNPSVMTVAKKKFKFNGDVFSQGSIFPWQELGITEDKAQKLYRANFIALTSTPYEPSDELSDEAISRMGYKELRKELKQRGLPSNGDMKALRVRLKKSQEAVSV